MRYILFLLFSLTCFGQTYLNETFSNFYPDTTGKTIRAMFKFNSVNADSDYAGTQNLASSGFSANYVDELVQISGLESGSYSLSFNGSDEFFTVSNATGNDHLGIVDGNDYTIAYYVYYNGSYDGTVEGFNNRIISRHTNSAGNGEGFWFRAYDGADIWDEYKESATLVSGWNTVILVWDDDVDLVIYVNGLEISTTEVGTFSDIQNCNAGDFFLGKSSFGQFFGDTLAYYEFANSLYTAEQITEWGYLASGWASNSGGVTRDSWAFSQGVITDTVYYNTSLSTGKWKISVDIEGNSGGETYRILTSADASTWSDLGSGTAPANSTTTTITGTGLGYIGLAVSSAADTVFFDNLIVTPWEGGFQDFSGWNKFKGF